jgi:MFS family permease
MFFQQFAFGGFEQLLSLFTLNRLGMNASDNAALFVFVGVIVVAVQGYFIGRWSRRFGERKLIYFGLATLAVGLLLTATTPRRPVPWYIQARLEEELTTDLGMPGETPPVQELAVDIPDDTNRGWLGFGWLLAAMIPASIGGGILQPSINSLITKRVEAHEIGGTLGISTAFFSGANAITPVVNGAIFDAFGSTAPFLIGGIILAILCGLAILLVKPGKEAGMEAGLARGGAGH